MKILLRILQAAIVIATVLVVAQWKQVSATRKKLEHLRAGRVEEAARAPLLPSVSAEIENEIAELRTKNRDIHKLRGQIAEARQTRREVEGLQAQNTTFRRQIEEAKTNRSATFPLLNKGQGTPEAALETAFWSMYQGDLQNLARVMPMMTDEFERRPPEERTNSVMMLKAMASTIQGMQVLDRKLDSANEVELTVEMQWREGSELNSAFGPKKSAFVLRQTNNLWQVVAEHHLE
jgi:hypothetical protein